MDLYNLTVGGTFWHDLNAAPPSVRDAVLKAVYTLLGGPLPGLCELDIEPLNAGIQDLYTAVVPGVAGFITYQVHAGRRVELLSLECR